MLDFAFEERNGFAVLMLDGGTPVTGLTASDVSVYYSFEGSSATQYSLSSSEFTEIGATNFAGAYFVSIGSSVFDSQGEIIFNVDPGSLADRYLARGEIGRHKQFEDIDTRTQTIKSDVREIQGSGFKQSDHSLVAHKNRFNNRIPSEVALKSHIGDGSGTFQAPADTGLWDILGDGSESIPGLGSKLDRVLGLSQEFYRIFDHTYDADDNLVSATIRLYDNRTDTENDENHIAEYELDADYDAESRLIDYRMFKV